MSSHATALRMIILLMSNEL